MHILKPSCVSLLSRPIEYRSRFGLSISTLLFAPLQAPSAGHLLREQSLWNHLGRTLGATPVDEGVAKLQAEFLVHGHVYAPAGHSGDAVAAGVRLGEQAKAVLAFAPRQWVGGAPRTVAPFAPVPLRWEQAYGGPDHPPNPVGMGRVPHVGVHWLPQLELPHARLMRPDQVVDAAGFGPLDLLHPQRVALRGTYDENYLKLHAPGFPPDLDWRHFNRAPQDQWLVSGLRGDEDFELRHLHPQQAVLKGRLPALRARVFAQYRLAAGEHKLKEVPLRLTTVWFFPEQERMVLIHQGLAEVDEHDASDIAALLAAVDRPATPQAVDHFVSLLEQRQSAQASPVDALDDSPLLPPDLDTSDPEFEQAAEAFKMEGLQAKAQRRRAEIEVTLAREKLQAAGKDPDALGVVLSPPEPQPTLAELPAHLKAQQAQNKAQQWDAVADVVQQIERAFDFMDQHKLSLADLARRGPPSYRADQHLAQLKATAGPDAPLDEAMLSIKFAQLELSERRDYLLAAHLQPPAHRQPDAAARHTRDMLQAMLARGVRALPDIDLTGADLQGLDLRGLDLTGAWLESADLRGANVSGCCFSSAVLAHADLRQCLAIGANFTGANLGRAQLADAVFDQAIFTATQLMHTPLAQTQCRRAHFERTQWLDTTWGPNDWTGAICKDNTFYQLDMRGWVVREAQLAGTQFIECDLRGVDFTQAALQGASFIACQLDGAVCAGAQMQGVVFVQNCSLRDLNATQADLSQANFGACVATGIRLVKARLNGAHLSEADLCGCDARLAEASGALWRKTGLKGARLAGINLQDAVLSHADLRGADLRDSNLFGADLSRVRLDDATRFDGALTQRARTWPRLSPAQQARAASED